MNLKKRNISIAISTVLAIITVTAPFQLIAISSSNLPIIEGIGIVQYFGLITALFTISKIRIKFHDAAYFIAGMSLLLVIFLIDLKHGGRFGGVFTAYCLFAFAIISASGYSLHVLYKFLHKRVNGKNKTD